VPKILIRIYDRPRHLTVDVKQLWMYNAESGIISNMYLTDVPAYRRMLKLSSCFTSLTKAKEAALSFNGVKVDA
jgi:hypothetical protein